jgi:catalase
MHESTTPPSGAAWRWGVIAVAVLGSAAAFAYVGGWFTPNRLTPKLMVDQLQHNSGLHPGFRRNHAKGICVAGYFESNGQAQPYSRAQVFAAGRTPVMGRLALPGGNPYAADNSVPIRSLALRFTQPNGQQWRTGMLNIPVFLVATPKQFYEQSQSAAPDPATRKPDPAKVKAFFASNPDSAPFLKWVATAKPSASYATEGYWGLNAFNFVNASVTIRCQRCGPTARRCMRSAAR